MKDRRHEKGEDECEGEEMNQLDNSLTGASRDRVDSTILLSHTPDEANFAIWLSHLLVQ